MSVPILLSIEGVLSIISNSVCQRCIPTILGEIQSKSAPMRAKITQYISIIMEHYPEDVIEKYLDGFSKALKKTLADADPQARNFSRQALSSLAQNFPEEAQRLVDSLDSSTKKQLSSVLTNGNQSNTPKTPQQRKITPGGKQITLKDDDDSYTKDSEKPLSRQTTKTKETGSQNRALSAVKKSPLLSKADTSVSQKTTTSKTELSTQAGSRHERKRSITSNSGKERASIKSVDPSFRDNDTKSPIKPNRTTANKSENKGSGGEFRDILSKLDHTVRFFHQELE